MADNENIMPDPDWVTDVQLYSQKLNDRPLSNDEIVDTFVLAGPAHRIATLRQLDLEDSCVTISADCLDVAAERAELKKRLNDLHRTMLRARR
jgi:hypothetical protein